MKVFKIALFFIFGTATVTCADSLSWVLGRDWDDKVVQAYFSSNCVRKFSTKVVTDYASGNITTNNRYIVSHPSQDKETFWEEGCGFPSLSYIPYLEVKTLNQSDNRQRSIISSVKIFNTTKGRDVLHNVADSLQIDDKLLEFNNADYCDNKWNIKKWFWQKPAILDKHYKWVDNHPENGMIICSDSVSNRVVAIWFDNNKLDSIELLYQNETIPETGTKTNKENKPLDLTFVEFGKHWITSINSNEVNSLKNYENTNTIRRLTIKERYTRYLKFVKRGVLTHTRMVQAGYALESEHNYGFPVYNAWRWYTSPCGQVKIETTPYYSYGINSEAITAIDINVKEAGGVKSIKLPNNMKLPDTPDKCMKMFTCRYKQQSLNKKQLLINCNEGIFLFIDNELVEAIYSFRNNSTQGIYALRFY